MPSLASDSFLVLAVLIFLTIALLLESLYLVWRSHRGEAAKKLKRRLDEVSGRDKTRQTQLLKQRMLSEMPAMERRLKGLATMRGLDRQIVQAGLAWSVSRLLLLCAAFGVGGWMFVSTSMHQSLFTGAAVGGLLSTLPYLYVRHKRAQRLARIETQLPDTLDLITRALRAGHAFTAGLKMAGEELSEPIAGEFRAVHEEINFGVSLEQALSNLSERVPLTDMRYFVVAVLIQRDSGGNLTEILGNLSQLIRERAKLLAKVKVLSSEGRLSAWILALLPFALGAAMYLANPKFMGPMFTDPLGITMLKYLLTMMLIGILVLRRIVRIRV
jgi:tight adherence protein B